MAVIRKVITRPGKYLVRTLDGNRAVRNMSKAVLAKTAKTGNEMIQDGLLIPAPYGHSDGKRIVPLPVTRDINDPNILLDAKTGKPIRWDHALIAGFWQKFEIDKDGNLVGYLQAEGNINDDRTHAGKIGKMFRQVSPVIHGEWVDGKGNLRENAPLHVCVTNKGVEFNQENFKAMPDESNLAIAMTLSEDDFISMSTDEEDKPPKVKQGDVAPEDKGGTEEKNDPAASDEGDDEEGDDVANPAMSEDRIGKIIVELKNKWSVTLPDDTNSSNFLDRLFTILCNSESEEEEESELDVEPEDGKAPKAPVIMALDHEATTKRANILLANEVAARKHSYTQRVDALVAAGIIGRAKADEQYKGKIEAFAMSLDDMDDEGRFPEDVIAMSLDMLENTALENEAPEDGHVPNQPKDMQQRQVEEVDQKTVDDILNAQPVNRRSYRPTM